MSSHVTCPGCLATLKAPDHCSGRTLKCPMCSRPFAVPAVATPLGTSSLQPGDASRPRAPRSGTSSPSPPARAPVGLTGALVAIAIIGFCLALIPFIGFIVPSLGLLACLGALAMAYFRRRRGSGPAPAGAGPGVLTAEGVQTRGLSCLSSLALRPWMSGIARLAAKTAEAAGLPLAAAGVETVEQYLESRFTDPSQELLDALNAAADGAWGCLEVALGGDTIHKWLTQKGEHKALAATVRAFLDGNPLRLSPDQDERFRRQALKELRLAHNAGLIPGKDNPRTLAKQAAAFSRFTDPVALCHAECLVLGEVAGQLRQAGHHALADMVELRPGPDQPPLLAIAVRFCFRCEVETNPRLFQGLVYEQVDGLRHELAAGFDGLADIVQRDRRGLNEALTAIAVQLIRIEAGQQVLLTSQEKELVVEGEPPDRVVDVQDEVRRMNDQLDRFLNCEIRGNDSRSVR
jgi:hypothetical protein